jgi:hypothetical protein
MNNEVIELISEEITVLTYININIIRFLFADNEIKIINGFTEHLILNSD